MKVLAVNISHKKGVIKVPVEQVQVKIDHGIVGDAHAGNWHRQISLLGIESFHKLDNKGVTLKEGIFAENITTEGIILHELPIGTKLQINDSILEVTQIGKECHHNCAIRNTIGDCVMPREGIFCRVIQEGTIQKGDKISIL